MLPETYGNWNILLSHVNLLVIMVSLCLDTAILRFYFISQDSAEEYRALIGSNLIFQLCVCALLTVCTLILPAGTLRSVLGLSIPKIYFVMIVFSTGISTVYRSYLALLSARQDGRRNGVVSFGYYIVFSGGSALLAVLGHGYLSFIVAKLITEIVFCVIAIWDMRKDVLWKFDQRLLFKSLRYSFPLVPHYLSGWALTFMSRIILNGYDSAVSVGIYTIGFQFGSIISIIVSRFHEAYLPWFFDHMKSGEDGKTSICTVSDAVVFGYCVLMALISLFSPEMVWIATAVEYHAAWLITPIICAGSVFMGLYYFYIGPCFYSEGGTKYATGVSFSASIINLILSFSLVPAYGIFGAAYATLGSSILSSIFAIWASARFERPKFRYTRHFLFIFCSMALSLLTYAMSNYLTWPIAFTCKVGIVFVAAVGGLYLLRRRISGIIKVWKST